jgi:TonB family protein
MTRTALSISALVLFFVPVVSVAQTTQQSNDVGCLDPSVRAPRTISFGVLNSRGINIPKPPYPEAARSAGLSGQVVAVIVIDETGQVMWARVVSGHALLQESVKSVVCQARLKPIRVAGRLVLAKGVLTYKFVLGWRSAQQIVEPERRKRLSHHS